MLFLAAMRKLRRWPSNFTLPDLVERAIKSCFFFFFFSDVLRSEATNADALLVRGLCYYYQDNVDRAFLHFKQVLLMAPDHAKARDVFRVRHLFSLIHHKKFLT